MGSWCGAGGGAEAGLTLVPCHIEQDIPGMKGEDGVRDGGNGQAGQESVNNQPCSCV